MILSGEVSGKIDRVCCGAVNLSGIIHGEAVFKMNTTTSCGWFQTNQQDVVGFVTENIMVCRVRQDGFANFIAVKQ